MPKSRALKDTLAGSIGGGRPVSQSVTQRPKPDPMAGMKPSNINARKLMKKVDR